MNPFVALLIGAFVGLSAASIMFGKSLRHANDKIEGLEEDLNQAVLVAYRRGAKEWARLNYPWLWQWLLSNEMQENEGEDV